ncbi:sulfur carrier protein ThiS [Roseovarius sp. C7]|uniref:sulfur carrier protein ThiS n=1 Tax=Roseovarius sp. C7 TaxID=3398643 RepID=UPI0039F6D571
MKLIVNASPREVQASTLDAALGELGFEPQATATALNGAFIPRDARAETVLNDGDRLEVLAPMQGG